LRSTGNAEKSELLKREKAGTSMKNLFLIALLIIAAGYLTLAGYAQWPPENIPPLGEPGALPVRKAMRAFRSDRELANYFREVSRKRQREEVKKDFENLGVPSAPAPTAQAGILAKADAQESVTNNQAAGVDEGGIVKVHGDHLVVLRRGRLFTIRIGDGALQPVSLVNAFGPDIDPRSTWYDEMLIAENTIAVIGYSYERGGTEVGLFNIDDAGRLAFRSTYHLRSNDYYSSRNYASRLIGNKLIFYTPLYLTMTGEDTFKSFPAVRRWHKDAKPDEFRRIVSATHVYRPERESEAADVTALHTVTVCDLANGNFDCNATAVLGPPGRVFYVSENSVYVWVSDSFKRTRNGSDAMLYRMPLDGSEPSAIGVSGSPVDQFSFLESEDNHLNVLVRSDAAGDAMWAPERAAGDVALLRLSLADFSDGSEIADASNYQQLTKPAGYTFQNRFVGNYLLYGSGNGWGYPQEHIDPSLFVVDWRNGESNAISLVHGVDRIEQLGSDAVVVGSSGKDLHFTAIRLDDAPSIAGTYTRKDASQGELRSHGFFYKPDGPQSGTLGLPISVAGRPGYKHLFQSSAAILFLRNDDLQFQETGELAARSERATDDGCRASCVDWYGNARPLFIRGRVLALLGYEIVEGTINEGRMRELRRVNYAPGGQVTRR
jgi:Beta propeller domain